MEFSTGYNKINISPYAKIRFLLRKLFSMEKKKSVKLIHKFIFFQHIHFFILSANTLWSISAFLKLFFTEAEVGGFVVVVLFHYFLKMCFNNILVK